MKSLLYLLVMLTVGNTFSQQLISGTVVDSKGLPVVGANIYIDGTYDGATSNEEGHFEFETLEEGQVHLIVSYVSYETHDVTKAVTDLQNLKVVLRDSVNALDAVVISAGTFEAGDNSKVSVLKPLDVVTTASALGDFVGALQTLPGTSTVAEDGRLFVRGGSADETQIFIDGIRVFTPYTPSTNNTPSRGRYSPFLFDGITFSTGGYSAEYGQALSSVLLLNTIDEPDQEKTDIGLMTVGGTLGHTEKRKRRSLSVNASYINLAPYTAIFPDRNHWDIPFRGGQGEAVFRQKFDSGLLKFYTAFDAGSFALTQEDINYDEGVYVHLKNRNWYTNLSYQGTLGKGWSLHSGMSYTLGKNTIELMESNIVNREHSGHFKLTLKKHFSNRVKLSFGGEAFVTNFEENFEEDTLTVNYGFTNRISAAYTEADIIFSKQLALKAGLRADYHHLFQSMEVAPRASLAFKTSKNGQLSLAYGQFYQTPSNDYLKFDQGLKAAHTSHYILNYQYVNDGKIFRAEAYRKDYHNLLTYTNQQPTFDSDFGTNGDGYAQGLDVFWRDNKTLKHVDYWLSYSYLDTKRNYLNFPEAATPNYANTHNLSVVGKYWIEAWKSQLGLSYTFASGRPYDNPNQTEFMAARTRTYNSLSVNWAYLISPQKILYLSVNNVLGIKNVNGYQYTNSPDMNGQYHRRALLPGADQFFFIGFFWTISDDGKSNQLDKL
ncbi:TonB-dependent receptor [Mangrovimonas sp. DI 80]|uniref:TonB-dependent receptor n=1 Tax=Mangrovimonas sp. DI 80 TaxID=1779330 RepID=UPI000975BA57|nr:TonB-dependent receptor [Mangrovimonas sp. DI 80]OMP31329.1 TonB-dependent receptor [Mangrovimonas sp. DI 80]